MPKCVFTQEYLHWHEDRPLQRPWSEMVICGSADLYTRSGKGPECSINFVTCHDGFTLNEMVSYRSKHNAANGENNRDGTEANFSENYGAKGETTDPGIEAVRRGQIKNFLLTLLISRGVPMLLGGDEFRRTQGGNNNAYCQDNATSWYDRRLLDQHSDIHRSSSNSWPVMAPSANRRRSISSTGSYGTI